MLTIPGHREDIGEIPGQGPALLVVFLLDRLVSWLHKPVYARVNLARLANVSYHANDVERQLDLSDQDGHSLMLLFSAAQAPPEKETAEKEAAVLRAIREHVSTSHVKVDLETRRALGIGDYLA
jgi:hypothetical protein